MKYVAIGRKSWLFFGSDRAAKDYTKLLSSIATRQTPHKVDPWAYLTEVIKSLSTHPNEGPRRPAPKQLEEEIPGDQISRNHPY